MLEAGEAQQWHTCCKGGYAELTFCLRDQNMELAVIESLEMLGVKPYAARRAANKFKDYDLELLKEQIRADFDNVDEAERIRRVRAIVDELESLFVQDSQSGKEALRDTWVNNPNAEDR